MLHYALVISMPDHLTSLGHVQENHTLADYQKVCLLCCWSHLKPTERKYFGWNEMCRNRYVLISFIIWPGINHNNPGSSLFLVNAWLQTRLAGLFATITAVTTNIDFVFKDHFFDLWRWCACSCVPAHVNRYRLWWIIFSRQFLRILCRRQGFWGDLAGSRGVRH